MNYRHAFHAGNFADVLKHAVLARIIAYLIQKPGPLRFIDTHAGIGWYDLDGNDSARTGEWRDGIGRLDLARAEPTVASVLAPYLEALGPRDEAGKPREYPGSPGIAQHGLRPTDRLLLCELHPDDATALRLATGQDKRVRILAEDGYRALKAAVPPPERRGVVLVDPPFEDKTEFDAMGEAVTAAYRKWPTGTYMMWHPVKDALAVGRFHQRMAALALPRWLTIVIERDRLPEEPERLRGCGLFVINPPYTLQAEAEALTAFLAACFDTPARPPWRSRVRGYAA